MVKHNNVVPNAHFHKDWDKRVRMSFNQPMRAKRRHVRRLKRAAKISPRPIDGPLRPIVRCPTLRYNMRQRLGRGFSLEEVRGAGLSPKKAMTIGIAIDHRRTNGSEESLQENVGRLKTYLSKLVVFPKNATRPKKDDAPMEEVAAATQLQTSLLPISKPKPKAMTRVIKADEREKSVFKTQRVALLSGKQMGKKKKKLAQKKKKGGKK